MNRNDPLYRFSYWVGKGIALVLWHTLPKSTMINLAERKGWLSAYEAKQAREAL